MLTKYLVVFRIACTMPFKSFWCGDELDAAALSATFCDTAVETAGPSLNLLRLVFYKLNCATFVNGPSVA